MLPALSGIYVLDALFLVQLYHSCEFFFKNSTKVSRGGLLHAKVSVALGHEPIHKMVLSFGVAETFSV